MSNDGGNKGNNGGGNKKGRDLNYQQHGGKTGSTFQTYRDGKAIGVDKELKDKIEGQKLEKFYDAGKVEEIKTGSLAVNIIGNALKDPLNKGSRYTREYFADKVLSSKRSKQNIGYTQAEFMNLSSAKQNEVYGNYLDNRMSGKTDAYGNPTGGWRKENVSHTDKFGKVTTKEVWMGGNDNDNRVQKSTFQLEQENKAAAEAKAKAESEAKEQAAKEQADAYKKKRLSVVGSRSLFANPGGRGFFN